MSSERQPDIAVQSTEAVLRARAALANLPVDQRRAVVLAAMYGWTAVEIADSESIALGTAKSRIRIGMAKLREAVVIEESP
jgi:RNA polymerase sigma-70 factor (ECF subfamily)